MPWNTAGNIKGPKGDKGEPGNAADVAALIHAAASKTPADADELPLLDSGGSWALRKFTWATLKSTLQALFFYRGNILGAVSQSGGVPTGSIIQRGSNLNGEFVRLADGTQICTNKVSLSSQAIAAGGLSTSYDWTYPASFSAVPNMSYSATGSFSYAFTIGAEVVSTTQAPSIYARNSATATLTTALTLHMTAIGRWY